MAKGQTLKVGNQTIPVTNLDKVLYPSGFTKGLVIDYYIRVADYLLPHLKDRPVTLKRYPDGVRGQFFYEKDAPGFTPKWVKTFPVPRRSGESDIHYILINDLPTLVWSANLANLEIHPFLHRVPHIKKPTVIVFDLDPGEGADVLSCAQVAFLLRDVLERLKLKSFVKVSGSKGIQLYVPLNTPVTYELTQPFARSLAQLLENDHPDLVVSEMAKSARTGKVFIDWSQNADHKTTVGVYSLRAKRERPFVSMPVTWEELERARKRGDAKDLYFEPEAALARLQKLGDLFAPVLKLKQHLPPDVTTQVENGQTARKQSPKALEAYRNKRDFSKTAEPAPGPPRRSKQGGRRRFVIQKHGASHLHYDFRLEMHDVLKSWAVPKGVPYTEGEKRLAMATEDHPVEYLDFEGTIPKGQYGGGTVMVWDIGTYELIEGNYYKGKLHLFLEGKKLKGEWVLTKTGNHGGKNWLLIKVGSAMKPLSLRKEDSSAKTGRTMERIASENDAQWQSNRAAKQEIGALANLPDAELKFIEPMRAKLTSKLPEGDNWQYEIKLDGYRALALKKDSVMLLSRNNNTLNGRFQEISRAFEKLENGTMIDGEIVALDDQGRPAFNLLQNYQTSTQPIVFYAFDLLAYRGKSLLDLPLKERRDLLVNSALARVSEPIRFSETLQAKASDLVAAAKEQELEGIVAKRMNSPYEPGERSGAWVKFRLNKGQELVIGGYMPGKHGFSSLLVGYYENKKLIFIAKVKNGFVPAVKEEVFARFKGLETDVCPFANLPEPKNARRGEALTAEVMKKCRWLKPKLVAEIEFTDWTAANHLRHSKFVALRDDKDAREVTRELPDPELSPLP
jgi:bifunctional non-homologous end joining protein LigD